MSRATGCNDGTNDSNKRNFSGKAVFRLAYGCSYQKNPLTAFLAF